MPGYADGYYTKPKGGGIGLMSDPVSGGGEIGGTNYWRVIWDENGFTGHGWSGTIGYQSFNITSVLGGGYDTGDDAAIAAALKAYGGSLGNTVASWVEANNWDPGCGYKGAA